jgi:hypothetical protein
MMPSFFQFLDPSYLYIALRVGSMDIPAGTVGTYLGILEGRLTKGLTAFFVNAFSFLSFRTFLSACFVDNFLSTTFSPRF